MASCKPCPVNTHCFGRNVVVPKKGYYKISRKSTEPVECLYREACLGGIFAANNSLSDFGYCSENF